MNFYEFKQHIIDSIKANEALMEIDVNALMIAQTDEALLLALIAQFPVLFSTGVLSAEDITSYFAKELLDTYYIFTEGTNSLYGKKTGIAIGNAIVHAYNDSTIYGFQHTEIHAHTLSIAYCYGDSKGYCYDNATMNGFENAKINSFCNSTVNLSGFASCTCHDDTIVTACQNSSIDGHERCVIYGNDNTSTVATDCCKVYLTKSAKACVYGRCDAEARDSSTLNLFEESSGNLYGRAIGAC